MKKLGCMLVGVVALNGFTFAAEAKKADPKMVKTQGSKMETKTEMAANDSKTQAAMMEEMMKMAQPSDAHKLLAQMSGKFDATVKFWTSPNAQPQESKAMANNQTILGGRFVMEDYQGMMMGKPFKGAGIYGYDNMKKKFFSTWMDETSTGAMNSEGTLDATGKILTFTGEMMDPMTQKMVKYRSVYRFENEKKYTMEMFENKDGKEFKSLEIAYNRSAK